MRILQVLTYYQPHVSGLTIYVDRLSKALVRQGHEVTVLTSQYESDLPISEQHEGVDIVRVPVKYRVSKGVIMPSFGPTAWRMVRNTDIVHLHLPQFDAPGVAFRGRLLNKPVVLTYHSDLKLPKGFFNRFVDRVVHVMNRLAGNLADVVVTYTRDFGSHSPFLLKYKESKLVVVPPPVELAEATAADQLSFSEKHQLNGHEVIGISARLAAEKGIEVLLKALPRILETFPEVIVVHAGPSEKVLGEESYAARLAPLFDEYRNHYYRVGTLVGSELTAFYKNLDCLVLCSLNNTETFGLVQIEAMQNGVPVVVSDLPGVRQPVTMTGMGEIVPIGDHRALADAIIKVLSNRDRYKTSVPELRSAFDPDNTASAYLQIYGSMLKNRKLEPFQEPSAYVNLKRTTKDRFDGDA